MTPTTTDPRVAAIFATEASRFGDPIVLVAKRGELAEELGNLLQHLELEVGVAVAPADFARVATAVPLEKAKKAFVRLGVHLPETVSKQDISRILEETHELTGQQVAQFIVEVLSRCRSFRCTR